MPHFGRLFKERWIISPGMPHQEGTGSAFILLVTERWQGSQQLRVSQQLPQ
jgi:hypothetical protein